MKFLAGFVLDTFKKHGFAGRFGRGKGVLCHEVPD